MFEWLQRKNESIIFLQETHCIKEDEQRWKKEWEGDILFSHGSRDAQGVMVLLKNNPAVKVINVSTGEDKGRVLYVTVNIYGIETLLVNIYAPNEDDVKFYERVFIKIREYELEHVVVGGDFNLVLDISVDKKGGLAKTNEKARDCVLKFMETLELFDIWRIRNAGLNEFTWRRKKPSTIQCRLDFFLLSQCMCNIVEECKIGISFLSDHSIVQMLLRYDNP